MLVNINVVNGRGIDDAGAVRSQRKRRKSTTMIAIRSSAPPPM
jgi:hypothetical protein